VDGMMKTANPTAKGMNPLVSVILPVYNGEACIATAVESICSQTFRNFELLIINDGSTDATESICQDLAAADSRIKLFTKPNGGVSSARNMGLDSAIGEYITFFDADDKATPLWLESFINNIQNYDLACQGMQFKGENIIYKLPASTTDNSVQSIIQEIIAKGILGYVFTKLFRRDIIINPSFGFRYLSIS
jgi:glycosyltransferase involved in cell wall biosynthesis